MMQAQLNYITISTYYSTIEARKGAKMDLQSDSLDPSPLSEYALVLPRGIKGPLMQRNSTFSKI